MGPWSEFKRFSEYNIQNTLIKYDLGAIKVGAKADEKCYDLSAKFNTMQDVMVSDWKNIKLADFPKLDEKITLASPIYNSEKCICVGLNYSVRA